VFITNGRTSEDNGYVFNYIFPNLKNERAFATFVDQINQRKLYNTGVDIKPTDKLITLSTCTYEFEEARLVVVGRMIRKGESESIDASKVRINSNPRYPQAWYDKKGLNNPYSGYSKWLPET
jgi:sortase B